MNGIHLCERCKYCTHSPNLFQPYYWCSWYGKEVKTPINRCDKITLKTRIDMKQTVEEAAKKYSNDCRNRQRHCEPYCIVDFISGAEWQSKQSPWISVNERLPENNTVVLTRGAYGFLICQLSSLGEWETGANVNKERLGITHWMPIPSFDEILEANRDVLERIKQKGD
jgi:hypothetical protein